MIVTIMQPAYLPWLGFFDRALKSDLLIVLDHVQIDMSSKTKFANRNKIRTKESWAWLTVPLKTKGKYGSLYLNELEINNEEKWRQKHFSSLRHGYGKAEHFREHENFFEKTYQKEWSHLVPLCNHITNYVMEAFSITTPIKYSSEMKTKGEKADLILNLCKEAGASTYISGPMGRDYLTESAFNEVGIKLVFHDYTHPEYPQVHGGFQSYMSAIDLLFNCGPESRSILEDKNFAITAAA